MKGPYQFQGDNLVHVPSGRTVGSATCNMLTVFDTAGNAESVKAARHDAMKALRKLQAKLNSKALLDAMGIY